ncbi:helix-turn-helix domain-containing protein [Nonomuraea sp. NPDC050643]|uniref:helix-turn-helix domain-containing protein n=1 Tax=Nonomuraea sp. NPDC050643 TaxID=3155660 RepID=UPI0033CD604B
MFGGPETHAAPFSKFRRIGTERELALATGRSYGFVHRLLQEAGVTLRSRGGARKVSPLIG